MITHCSSTPIRHLKRQKRVIAQDYPFFVISLWHCTCGCDTYSVTLHKTDIGYTKQIFDIEYNTPLEAFIKFENFVAECKEGKYDIVRTLKEGQSFE